MADALERLEEWTRWYRVNVFGSEATPPVMQAAISGLGEVLEVALREMAELQRQLHNLQRGYRGLG